MPNIHEAQSRYLLSIIKTSRTLPKIAARLFRAASTSTASADGSMYLLDRLMTTKLRGESW
jgi:hypothetical protein